MKALIDALHINPKVVASAVAATLAGGLTAAGTSLLTAPQDTARALVVGAVGAFLIGASTGISGWFKDQGNWEPRPPA